MINLILHNHYETIIKTIADSFVYEQPHLKMLPYGNYYHFLVPEGSIEKLNFLLILKHDVKLVPDPVGGLHIRHSKWKNYSLEHVDGPHSGLV